MIIVTGGAGLIGANMIWELNRQGEDDILVVDNLASTEKWKNLSHLRYSNYMHRDRFLEELRSGKKLEGVDCVIHMGACSSTTLSLEQLVRPAAPIITAAMSHEDFLETKFFIRQVVFKR